MTPISQFAGRLAGQFAASWGGLPIASAKVVAIHANVPLPSPWERLPLRTLRTLEEQLQARPQLVYAVSAVLGLDEGAVRDGMGDRYEPLEFQRLAKDCRDYVQDNTDPFQIPSALRKIENKLDEKEALKIFQGLSAPDLNRILWDLHRHDKLHGLVNDFKSGIFYWWSNKRVLVKLLTKVRLAELTIPVRAALVYAMQKGVTARVMEEGITHVIEGTLGDDLTRLKNIIDRRSPQDMLKLVYGDVGSKSLRRRILRHIAAQVSSVKTGILMIVSDIDDTVFRNWNDPRYPAKAVYPGMHAFYRAVGRFDANDWERRGPAFDSARPGIVEKGTVDTLRGIGFPFPTVLSGDLLHLIGASIATGKFNNFVPYDRLFPEFLKVLIGDNGQYDVDFGQRALEAYAETVLAVFIHNVKGEEIPGRDGYIGKALATPLGNRRLFYFDTYIGAALAAFEIDSPLISLDDLHRVAGEALAEFENIVFASDTQRDQAWNLLKRDFGVVEKKHGKTKFMP